MDKNQKQVFQYALGAVIVVGFFCLLGGLLFVSVPTANEKSFDIMLGILAGGVGAVIGYFYGSSLGSSNKDEIISNQTPKA